MEQIPNNSNSDIKDLMDDIVDKLNEIIDWINTQ